MNIRKNEPAAASQSALGDPRDMSRLPRLIVPKRFVDQRGWFCETWNERRLAAEGLSIRFVQDNESCSARRGTIRGLHYQAPPHAQAKLVRAVRGRIYDVAVDVRRGSPTYGRFVGAELSDQNGHQLYIPAGFAHGFCSLDEQVQVAYKVSDFYAPECEGGIRFDDATIAIPWPVAPDLVCTSDKDARHPALADWESPFDYDGVPLTPLAPA